MARHAALDLEPALVLNALIAERLDRLYDRMVLAGHTRLAVLARPDHLDWLLGHVHEMAAFPVAAVVRHPSAPLPGSSFLGRPLLDLSDPSLPLAADTVLIADDLHEAALHERCLRALPPGMIIHRLYERLPIGRSALPPEPPRGMAAELKPSALAAHAAA
ncbi:MAG: hypothetical protein IBJ11_03565 [Phycisphaerales bacterium]|nr:hypothetical protein [Phycisphaerales bacterium]